MARGLSDVGMMCSYNSVSGIPTCLSPMLKKAREIWTGKTPWGGYITSDSDSVADAVGSHHFVSTLSEASCRAVRDGGDDIDSGNTYYNHLLEGVAAGHCSMSDIDNAIKNTLKVRFELGLFDPVSSQPLAQLGSSAISTVEAAQLNLRASAESLVLLKNERGILPLKAGRNIAVVGPHANATRFLLQVDTGGICAGDGTFDCVETPFQAIRRLNVRGHTQLAVGCDVIDPTISTPELLAEAVYAARAADTVVLAIGIGQCGCMGIADSYMGGRNTNPHGCATSVVPPFQPWGNCWNHKEIYAGRYIGAEAHDRILIDLPLVQRRFAAEIFKLGKPTVLLLLNGGSIDIGPEIAAADAVLEAFYPGQAGAAVIANSLFGTGPDFNRFGRMPYTIYKADFVNSSSMLEHDLSVPPGKTHKYYTGDPVVRFGAGLSYSNFKLTLKKHDPLIIATDGSINVTLTVVISNDGPVAGDEVILAFLEPQKLPSQPGSRLLQKLWDFKRVSDVAVGTTTELPFVLTVESLALADIVTGDIVSAPGEYRVRFDDGSGHNASIPLTITGPQRVLEPFPQV